MYAGPTIDLDVHHNWPSEGDLVEYLPKEWREFVDLGGGKRLPLHPALQFMPRRPAGTHRLETFPEKGAPGSDYDLMKEQLLDPLNIAHAILGYDIGLNPGITNIYLASALTRAINEWTVERWLSIDDPRLHGTILLPTQSVTDAVAEIRRFASHPKIVEIRIVVNGLGKPFGHPSYHPIYEAAVEYDLPVAFHIGGDQSWPAGAQTSAGGTLGSRFERFATLFQPASHHLASLLVHGVFEKYPSLRVIIIESGVAWIPALLWELDSQIASLRSESPWIRRLPSEYFRDHVRVTTQPLDESPDRRGLIELLEALGGMEDVLCFATDYPHWDADDPRFVAGRLPKSWLPKIFYENAAKLYGWPTAADGDVVGPESQLTSTPA